VRERPSIIGTTVAGSIVDKDDLVGLGEDGRGSKSLGVKPSRHVVFGCMPGIETEVFVSEYNTPVDLGFKCLPWPRTVLLKAPTPDEPEYTTMSI
jgi:hypothetical protein